MFVLCLPNCCAEIPGMPGRSSGMQGARTGHEVFVCCFESTPIKFGHDAKCVAKVRHGRAFKERPVDVSRWMWGRSEGWVGRDGHVGKSLGREYWTTQQSFRYGGVAWAPVRSGRAVRVGRKAWERASGHAPCRLYGSDSCPSHAITEPCKLVIRNRAWKRVAALGQDSICAHWQVGKFSNFQSEIRHCSTSLGESRSTTAPVVPCATFDSWQFCAHVGTSNG